MTDHRLAVTLATIAVIAILAAGIGFAYAAYTANNNNTATPEYLIIVPSDGQSAPAYSDTFDGSVTFDTVTILDQGVQKVEYRLSDYDTISSHRYTALGEIYLAVNESKSAEDYNVSVVVDDGTGLNTDDFSYYAKMQIGSGETEADAREAAEQDEGSLVQLTLSSGDMVATSGTIDNDPDNGFSVVLLTMYVGMKGGDVLVKPLATPLNPTVLDSVTFLFKAETVG